MPGCAHGRRLHRTNTNFLLPSLTVDRKLCEAAALQIAILWLPWVPSRAQLAKQLLSNFYHVHSSSASAGAVDLSYSVRWWIAIDGLQHYVWRSKVRPHDQDSALLQNSSRENARRAALSVLCAKSEHACESLHQSRAVQAICAERSTSANNDGDGDGREKARTADGALLRDYRQRKEKGLQSTPWKYLRRSKKKRHNVPDSHRALHMHVLERDFSIRAACVQHDCATCASMQRDAVTAAQSRFLATASVLQSKPYCWCDEKKELESQSFLVCGAPTKFTLLRVDSLSPCYHLMYTFCDVSSYHSHAMSKVAAAANACRSLESENWPKSNSKPDFSGRLTSGKGYLARAQCVRPVIRSDLQWSDAIWPRTRAAGRARAAQIGDRKQSDSYTDMYACAPLSVSMTTQNGGRSLDVLPASRRFDRGSKQS